jgi:hypothetical protein
MKEECDSLLLKMSKNAFNGLLKEVAKLKPSEVAAPTSEANVRRPAISSSIPSDNNQLGNALDDVLTQSQQALNGFS